MSAGQYSNRLLNAQTAHNPFDKLTQPDFDVFISGITSSLKTALGRNQPAVQPPLDSPSGSHTPSSGASHVPFSVSKGKQRDPREGPGLGNRCQQPIEILSSGDEGPDPNLSFSEQENEDSNSQLCSDWSDSAPPNFFDEDGLQPMNQDTAFPPHQVHSDCENLELPDLWEQAEEYAEDLYTGGDAIIPTQDVNCLGMEYVESDEEPASPSKDSDGYDNKAQPDHGGQDMEIKQSEVFEILSDEDLPPSSPPKCASSSPPPVVAVLYENFEDDDSPGTDSENEEDGDMGPPPLGTSDLDIMRKDDSDEKFESPSPTLRPPTLPSTPRNGYGDDLRTPTPNNNSPSPMFTPSQQFPFSPDDLPTTPTCRTISEAQSIGALPNDLEVIATYPIESPNIRADIYTPDRQDSEPAGYVTARRNLLHPTEESLEFIGGMQQGPPLERDFQPSPSPMSQSVLQDAVSLPHSASPSFPEPEVTPDASMQPPTPAIIPTMRSSPSTPLNLVDSAVMAASVDHEEVLSSVPLDGSVILGFVAQYASHLPAVAADNCSTEGGLSHDISEAARPASLPPSMDESGEQSAMSFSVEESSTISNGERDTRDTQTTSEPIPLEEMSLSLPVDHFELDFPEVQSGRRQESLDLHIQEEDELEDDAEGEIDPDFLAPVDSKVFDEAFGTNDTVIESSPHLRDSVPAEIETGIDDPALHLYEDGKAGSLFPLFAPPEIIPGPPFSKTGEDNSSSQDTESHLFSSFTSTEQQLAPGESLSNVLQHLVGSPSFQGIHVNSSSSEPPLQIMEEPVPEQTKESKGKSPMHNIEDTCTHIRGVIDPIHSGSSDSMIEKSGMVVEQHTLDGGTEMEGADSPSATIRNSHSSPLPLPGAPQLDGPIEQNSPKGDLGIERQKPADVNPRRSPSQASTHSTSGDSVANLLRAVSHDSVVSSDQSSNHFEAALPRPGPLFHNHSTSRHRAALHPLPGTRVTLPQVQTQGPSASLPLAPQQGIPSSSSQSPTDSPTTSPRTPAIEPPAISITTANLPTPPKASQRATRSNCRYHKISIPKEEDGSRVHFLVPGCSLSKQDVMEECEIEDHGEATVEKPERLINDIEDYFDPYLVGNIRKLVGVDLIREKEVYYVLAENEIPAHIARRRIVRHGKRPSRQFDSTSPRSSQGSFASATSFSPRAPVSAAGSVSTVSTLGRERREEAWASDQESTADPRKPKRAKHSVTMEDDLPSTSNTATQKKPAAKRPRRRGLPSDAAAYQPTAASESSGSEEGKKVTFKSKGRKSKRRRTLENDDETEGQPIKRSRKGPQKQGS